MNEGQTIGGAEVGLAGRQKVVSRQAATVVTVGKKSDEACGVLQWRGAALGIGHRLLRLQRSRMIGQIHSLFASTGAGDESNGREK